MKALTGLSGLSGLIPTAEPLLLDNYPALAAYSLRRVRAGANLSIRIRRSSDNAEQDIGFVGNDLDTDAINTFVGANSAYVVTVYDQSGNGFNKTNATAALQPRIVNAGALETKNSLPAYLFDGSDDFQAATITGFQSVEELSASNVIAPASASSADANTFFTWWLGNITGTVNRFLSIGSGTGSLTGETLTLFFGDGTGRRLGASGTSWSAGQAFHLLSFHLSSGTTIRKNGAEESLNLSSDMTTSTPAAPADTGWTTNDRVLFNASHNSGAGGDTAGPSAHWQECILWDSDQTANIAAIEADVNDYWGVY